jgi:hypothetical protein
LSSTLQTPQDEPQENSNNAEAPHSHAFSVSNDSLTQTLQQEAPFDDLRIVSMGKWPLRYYKKTIYLLAFYSIVLVLPWILTCVTRYRPLKGSSYFRSGYMPVDVRVMNATSDTIRVLNSIAMVITIPVISAVLAHASIVYTQRRKGDQTLKLPQTLALADRSWADFYLLWGMRWPEARASGSEFLWVAAGVLFLGE